MIYTNLKRLKKIYSWERFGPDLLTYLNKTKVDRKSLAYSDILKAISLFDTCTCCAAEQSHDREWRLIAIRWARLLIKDSEILDIAESFANGLASEKERIQTHAAAGRAWCETPSLENKIILTTVAAKASSALSYVYMQLATDIKTDVLKAIFLEEIDK